LHDEIGVLDEKFSRRATRSYMAAGKRRTMRGKGQVMKIHSSARFLLFAFLLLALSSASFAQVSFSVSFGPPAIPVYVQPPCPAEGYIWTPGFWAWNPDFGDYYWVPGTWVQAPQVGYLWTPGWWGWGGSAFIFHAGYWGPRIGFYGGINYGFGYFGHGYEGGRWDHDRFYYNRSVTNVNVTNVTNVYNTTVINNNNTRISYNGGHGGIEARPTEEQLAAEHERHLPPVAAQTQHVQAARGNPDLRASANHGRPPIAATERPGAFKEGAVPAREAGGPYNGGNREGQPTRGENNVPKPPSATHVKDLPPHERPTPPNTGDPKLDTKYQQQQQKLYAKQEQERQKMQQKQEQDHQKLTRQNADQARQQQVEQHHQQQTQQLQERHVQQQQQMQQRQQPPRQQPPSHGEPQHH
jgi:hypothetical protein